MKAKSTVSHDVSLIIKVDRGHPLSPTIIYVSILEDLWHDYLDFKKQAEMTSEDVDMFRHKRYLRAALLFLTAYLEGVTNKWCTGILAERGESKQKIEKYIRKPLKDKCKFLTKEVSAKNPSISEPTLASIKQLRNGIVHLKIGSNIAIFQELTFSVLSEAENNIIGWLDVVGKLLGKERHPDTRSIGRKLAQGQDFSEDYSGDDLN